jgi:hypothetical protein
MRHFKVKEIDRDENLAVIKKEVSIDNSFLFRTPSKATKNIKPDGFIENNSKIHEIVKRIDDPVLNSLEEGASSRIAREIKNNYRKDKLNIVIFNLMFDKIPDKNRLGTLAQHLYASSDSTVFLPAVRSALLKENNKISENKINAYLGMMKFVIEQIRISNSKALIGVVPLLAPKYSRQIVNFYLDEGITAFSVDANTSDLLGHETDFRSILSTINERVPLNRTFIHACNLGYPQFEKEETRADDFLSIFAYIDVIGGTFKIRGKPNGKPRLKQFMANNYGYRILPSYSYQPNDLRNINQVEQLKEAMKVSSLVGQDNIERYIQQKPKVDNVAIDRLKTIAGKIKIK